MEAELEGKPLPGIDELESRLHERIGPLMKPRSCRASCVCHRPANDLGGSVEFKQYQAAVLLAEALTEAHARLLARRGGGR